ncbi:MAG: T9SS type A sorting domain-containing protein [Salibacteraceae bacterium]
MKLYLTLFLLITQGAIYAQDFKLVGNDAAGDSHGNNRMDITSMYIATDVTQDYIWIKLGSNDSIKGDWGFSVLFDTNSVPTDGKPWDVTNNGGNYDLKYDLKLDVLNNNFFPPTYAVLTDTNGLDYSTNIQLTYPNDHTIIIRMKLSELDANGEFNFIAAGGQFDGIMNDNLPNSGYGSFSMKTTSVTEKSTSSEDKLIAFPNPFNNEVKISGIHTEFDYSIIDITGNIISNSINNSGQATVNLSSVPNGFYFIRLSTPKKEFHKTIIKQ